MNQSSNPQSQLNVGKIGILTEYLNTLLTSKDMPNIEKTLKQFSWHSTGESLNDTHNNKTILLKIINIAFCAGPDIYSSLFNSILIFIFNLVLGLDKMKVLTESHNFNLKHEMFSKYRMFELTDGTWRSVFGTIDIKLKNELTIVFRNLEQATQLIREILSLYPSTMHSIRDMIYKTFPNKNFNILYKQLMINNLFQLCRNNENILDAQFRKVTEYVIDLESDYISIDMTDDDLKSNDNFDQFIQTHTMLNKQNFCNLGFSIIESIQNDQILKIQSPRFIQFLQFEQISKSTFVEKFVDNLISDKNLYIETRANSINNLVIIINRLHHYFSFICRSKDQSKLIKIKFEKIVKGFERVILYQSENDGMMAIQFKITVINGLLQILQFYHKYQNLLWDNFMYKVISANSKQLNRDLLSGFLNFRKVTLKMKINNDAEEYKDNLLFVQDLKDENMLKQFSDRINQSDQNE